jgi:hypothetical protein
MPTVFEDKAFADKTTQAVEKQINREDYGLELTESGPRSIAEQIKGQGLI